MKGAKKYSDIFDMGGHQFGKLYIVLGKHARGYTLCVYILPDGVIECADRYRPLCDDAVQVYGIVSGNPGWTEKYGWLYEGKWQEDFDKIVQHKRKELQAKKLQNEEERCKDEAAKEHRTNELLSKY
jgi:hypothetical protein